MNRSKKMLPIILGSIIGIGVLIAVIIIAATGRIGNPMEERTASSEVIESTQQQESEAESSESELNSAAESSVTEESSEYPKGYVPENDPSMHYSDYLTEEDEHNLPSIPILDDGSGTSGKEAGESLNDLDPLSSGQAANTGSSTLQLVTGEKITIGLSEKDAPDDDYVYISPVITGQRKDVIYCISFMSTRVEVEYSQDETDLRNHWEWGDDIHVFYKLDETYDTLLPAEKLPDGCYGARWRNYVYWDGSEGEDANTTIYMHVAEYDTGTYIGAFAFDMIWNSEISRFELKDFRSNDVRDTGALTEEERADIVWITCDELKNQQYRQRYYFYTEPEIIDASAETCIVEKLPDILYSPCRFVDDALALYPHAYYGVLDIYAVHINYSQYSSVTFYFAPYHQTLGRGFDSPYAPGSDDLQLELFGYSANGVIDMETFIYSNISMYWPGEGDYMSYLPAKFKNYIEEHNMDMSDYEKFRN